MDPFPPPSPQPIYFDTVLQGWVISRHAEALAALREPALQPVAPARKLSPGTSRAQAAAAIAKTSGEDWRRAIGSSALQVAESLPSHGRIDLLREVIQPVTRHLALATLADAPVRKRLLARLLDERAATSSRGGLRRKLTGARFELFFRGRPGEKSVVIGVSETLPAFLANAWIALLRHPAELTRLRGDASLLPAAIEELLRHAGLVHSLVRVAAAEVTLGRIRIAPGERVILKLASANRDPEQFVDPECFDLSRRSAGHLALGHGEHSCVGAAILRTTAAELTRLFLGYLVRVQICGEIPWRWGDTLVSPEALPVVLDAEPAHAISH